MDGSADITMFVCANCARPGVRAMAAASIGAVLDEIVLAIERFVQGAKLQDDVSLLGIEFKNGKCQ